MLLAARPRPAIGGEVSWLDGAEQEKAARRRRAERYADTVRAFVEADLTQLAERTWGRLRTPWDEGPEIAVDHKDYRDWYEYCWQVEFTKRTAPRGHGTKIDIQTYTICIDYDSNVVPKAVRVDEWRIDVEDFDERSLREALKECYLRGPSSRPVYVEGPRARSFPFRRGRGGDSPAARQP